MKSYDKIKNYTTTITVEKTVMEIERMLATAGASKILKEYDTNGNIILLTFIVKTDMGEIPIRLPLEIDKIILVFNGLVKTRKLPQSYYNNKPQALRVCWRILKDWLDAQLTLIQIDTAKMEQIFLPYVYDYHNNITMYQAIKDGGFQMPILSPREDGE
jgi:hypothetical protein